jgi:metal-responsive CopG/Arc/MetJ family transcriptional regulator
MKTAVSIPDPLFKEAEAAAKKLGLSRSRFIQIALEAYLERRREEELTAEINRNIEKYGDPSDGEEAWLEHSQQLITSLERDG